MKKLILLILSTTLLFSCDFKEDKLNLLCKEMLKKNIPLEYIKSFLTQPKSNYIDFKTLKYIQPKMIKQHHKNEKKANNNLLKYLPQARKHLKKYKEVYDYTENKYNVNRGVIAGILLKETRLGTYKPKHSVYITLNTIFRNIEPNTKRNTWLYNLSQNNLLELANFCYKNKYSVSDCDFPSSYIGAIGIPQFMPNNLYLAKSFSNKSPNITNMEDSIVSVGNYFSKRSKWKEKINWNTLPDISQLEKEWYEYDFKHTNSTFAKKSKKYYNCFACDKKDLKKFNEYVKKVMRYNNSSNYAIGVLRLAYELEKK